MNKEQINKHKEVMLWFIENLEKGVWSKISNTVWHLTRTPEFGENNKYVQNDEYCELRKYVADGKEIIYKCGTWSSGGEDRWLRLNCRPTSMNNGNDFYNFKWKLIDDVSHRLVVVRDDEYKLKPDEPTFKVGNWVTDGYTIWQHDENCRATENTQLKWKLWKPTEGEWCVFWDDRDTNYRVSKYGRELDSWHYSLNESISTRKIAPLEFIQTLKN